MDWAKAKSILIFIFLVLNIFLLFNVVKQESKTIAVSQKDISDVKAILQSNNIDLKAQIPNKIKAKAFLQVDDNGLNEKDIATKYFGTQDGVLRSESTGTVTYKKMGKSVEIYPSKKLIFKDSAPNDNLAGLNEKKAEDHAKKFLKSLGINLKYGVLERSNKINGGFEVRFVQEYKDFKIFGSYINIKVSAKGISEAEIVWFNPVGFVDEPKEIKSPIEILMTFARERKDKGPIGINEISLGYYLPSEEIKNATVSAVPVWKIETTAGETLYYNAYEGYLEKSLQR